MINLKPFTKLVIGFSPILLFAESYLIDGKIFDADTGDPLSFANIYFHQTDIGCVSDVSGYFKMDKVPFQSATLVVSVIGYQTLKQDVKFPIKVPLELGLKKELIEMSSIVVTGTRTERYLKDVPITTQVIKGEKLQRMGAQDVSSVLSEITGIAVVENQFGTGVEIGGFDADHILVMIDGMRMIGRTNGQLDISQIAVDQIERIEIVKGAASAIYGSEAMGGVVNIITKQPEKEFTSSIYGDIGSFNRINGNLSLTGGLGNWLSKFHAGLRMYGGDAVNGNSLWEDGSKYNKVNVGFQIDGQLLSNLKLRLINDSFIEDQILNVENVFEDIVDNRRFLNRIEMDLQKGEFVFKPSVEVSHYNHLYEQFVVVSGYKRKSDRTIDDRSHVDLLFQSPYKNHQLNGGFGIVNESIQSDRITSGSSESNLLYLFGQDDWEINDKYTLLTGIRIDNHSQYGLHYSPKIALMYKPGLVSRVRFSYGRGFRAPSFKELYLDFQIIQAGYHIFGSPDLKPEISSSFSLDIERWNSGSYHGRISFFHNQIHNLIDYVSAGVEEETNLHLWETANLKRARTMGMDLDLKWFITSNVEWSVGYGYLDSWDVDNESPINLKAKHKLNQTVEIKLPYNISWNIRAQHIGQRYYGEEGVIEGEFVEEWIDDYTLFHTNFSIPVMNLFELNTGIKNITDVYDETWGPMPGREWYIGIKMNTN